MEERAVRGISWTILSYGGNRVVTVATTIILATGSVKRPIPGTEFGGRVIGGGFCFGDYDVVLLASFPNNASAAAAAMAFGAGGTVRAVKTTPLLSSEEAVEAMTKGSQTGYKPVT